MIKFVLLFIAVTLMTLGIYNYSNQSTEKNTPTPTISEKKKEVKETEKVSVVAQEVKEKKSSAKNIMVKSPKVVSTKSTHEMVNKEEIGKGLTLESIENADVSDEEKEIMLTDMLYYQNKHNTNNDRLTPSEIDALMTKDIEEGRVP
jgi:hypothetical protein